MPRLDFLKRLVIEDFKKEDRDLISKIAFIFNPALEAITNALNHGMNITDLNVQMKEFDITVDAAGAPKAPTAFKSGIKGSCKGLSVIYASNPSVTPTGALFISFTEDSGVITVNKITGLQADTKYTLRVLIYA